MTYKKCSNNGIGNDRIAEEDKAAEISASEFWNLTLNSVFLVENECLPVYLSFLFVYVTAGLFFFLLADW